MGLSFLLGTEFLWPLLLALTCAPNIISCAVLPFCPESPRYVFKKKGEDLARKGAQQTHTAEQHSLNT